MVSAGVCYGGKGRLHFVDEKAKINTQYYVNNLLPKLFKDSSDLLPNKFIFNKTELLPTCHGTHRNGLRRTVLTSSVRMNGRLTIQILTPWITTFGAPC